MNYTFVIKKLIYRSIIIILCVSPVYLGAETTYSVTKKDSNLGIIWGLDFLDDSTLIMTQKSGDIIIYNLDTQQKNSIKLPFSNLYSANQGGLLDIQVHRNGYIYITASREYEDSINTVLSRFKLKNNAISDFEDIFITKTLESGGRHFGSRIVFDDIYVYFSIGDRGNRDSAQDLLVHNGSIIRIYSDGSIPKENPSFAMNGIYSYGHRNPQGLFYDTTTNILWSIEHGPRGGDEINIIEQGKNYGWPVISYGKEYWAPLSVGEGTHKTGMQQPIYQFTPSIAPSDMLVYRANNSHDGRIISSSLKLRHLNIITIKDAKVIHEERILEELKQRIRSIVQHKQSIYLTTDAGNLYKLDFN